MDEPEPQLPCIPAPPDYARCLRCRRPLRDPKSRQLGFGPSCAEVISLNVRLLPAVVAQAVRASFEEKPAN